MQKAYLNLVKYALAQGCRLAVFDGEEWPVVRCTSYKEIVDAIESVEQAEIVIRRVDGRESTRVAWALIIPFGLEPDETVADYSDNAWMAAWEAQYAPLNA